MPQKSLPQCELVSSIAVCSLVDTQCRSRPNDDDNA